MAALDRRLLREAPEVGRFLAGAALLAVLSAVAAIVWAVLIGKAVARVFLEGKNLHAISGLLVAAAMDEPSKVGVDGQSDLVPLERVGRTILVLRGRDFLPTSLSSSLARSTRLRDHRL